MSTMEKRNTLVRGIQLLLILYLNVLQAQTTLYRLGDTIERNKTACVQAETEEHCWMGTPDGLIRKTKKNGKQRTFSASNSSLPSNLITSICCRKNGHVWIGTRNGIIVYDGYCFFLLNTENARIPDNLIRFILEDANEVVWIGTGTGLVKVRRNRFTTYDLRIKEVEEGFGGTHFFVTMSDVKISSGSL